ncbi:hypothetical protein RRG08_027198 [Elysia crispata]|uniref:Uncharacterized protein n=1 Tax=Elysia crispata TaxID=231223 RepID=A0AAE1DT64_9GAST|nr:hypothetical protein RRG08_027198 [Elysia crispata]
MLELYMTIIAVVLFFIPAIIIAVCYSIIVIIIWTKTSGGSHTREGATQHVKNGKYRSGSGFRTARKIF